MPKKLTEEQLAVKNKYRTFFKKFRDAKGISYTKYITKNVTDARSLSSFVNNEVEIRPIGPEKLERLKDELIANYMQAHEELLAAIEELEKD